MDKYNWTTEFDTKRGLMVHTISDRVKVLTNLHTKIAKVFKDGKETRAFDCDVPAPIYARSLQLICEDAERLKQFPNT